MLDLNHRPPAWQADALTAQPQQPGRVKFKNFCNMHIMWELPTIKTDFLFENSQDFNQTTHARPQHPIVSIDNISLYFNCISSVKYVF